MPSRLNRLAVGWRAAGHRIGVTRTRIDGINVCMSECVAGNEFAFNTKGKFVFWMSGFFSRPEFLLDPLRQLAHRLPVVVVVVVVLLFNWNVCARVITNQKLSPVAHIKCFQFLIYTISFLSTHRPRSPHTTAAGCSRYHKQRIRLQKTKIRKWNESMDLNSDKKNERSLPRLL